MLWHALGAVQIFPQYENQIGMMRYTYLLIDFCTVIIPLLFSFHPKLNFFKRWWAFFPAAILAGLCFIIWDEWFTRLGVWGFNQQYLTGVMISTLPLEELLFFLCIPYACVFTFHCLGILVVWNINKKIENVVTWFFVAGLITTGLLFFERIYTCVTFLSLAALLLMARYWFKINWLGKFYIVYGILLLPFLIVNGILTGTGLEAPVVWYKHNEILGLRLMTIPFEDIFYGMELILLTLLIYQHLLNKKEVTHKQAVASPGIKKMI